MLHPQHVLGVAGSRVTISIPNRRPARTRHAKESAWQFPKSHLHPSAAVVGEMLDVSVWSKPSPTLFVFSFVVENLRWKNI